MTTDSPSPYDAPESARPDRLPPTPGKQPPAVKVFGILHVVFGALGLVGAVMTLFSLFFMEWLYQNMPPGSIDKGSVDLIVATRNWSMVDVGLKSVLGVLLLVAGFGLLKRRLSGLRTSNIYSFLSLGHKVYAVIVLFFVTKPYLDQMYASMGGGDEVTRIAQTGGLVGGMFGLLLAAAYPIVALILLNRDPVKDALQ